MFKTVVVVLSTLVLNVAHAQYSGSIGVPSIGSIPVPQPFPGSIGVPSIGSIPVPQPFPGSIGVPSVGSIPVPQPIPYPNASPYAPNDGYYGGGYYGNPYYPYGPDYPYGSGYGSGGYSSPYPSSYDYPPSYPQPSYPQPYPYPAPSYPQPAPRPRECAQTTTCQSECSWRENNGMYGQICTVLNCRNEVQRYFVQQCSPSSSGSVETPSQGVEVAYVTNVATYFKAENADSATLSSQKKCLVQPSQMIFAKVLARKSEKVVKVILTESIDGCTSFGLRGQIGFIYLPHVSQN